MSRLEKSCFHSVFYSTTNSKAGDSTVQLKEYAEINNTYIAEKIYPEVGFVNRCCMMATQTSDFL